MIAKPGLIESTLKGKIIGMIHYTESVVTGKFNWSDVLTGEMQCDCNYLSTLFHR